VVARPRLTWPDVKGADALIIGGAGEHSATHRYAFTPFMGDIVRRWLDEKRPFFGSCFGHHFVAALLDGAVEVDPRSEEVGTFEVSLTDVGRSDRLFGYLPKSFPAQLGHHDRVAVLPRGAEALAHSGRCANQAIRLAGGAAYTTQFHPEMSVTDMRERLLIYRDGYLGSDDHLAAVDRCLRPTKETRGLLSRFVQLFC
jgi:GMP synthase (glutamine-hydrolysing)